MKITQGLSRLEQETFFRTSAADDFWDFYSRDPVFKRLLERRGWTVKEDHQGFWSIKLPRAALILRSKSSVERPVSPETAQRLGRKPKSESRNGVLPDPENMA